MSQVSLEQFGARLQELRLARGWTQRELAQKAGVKVWAVRHWESGKHEPGWLSVVALADALGVPTEAFREAPQAPRRKYAHGRKKKQAPPVPRQALCLGCGEPLAAAPARQRYHGSTCRSRAFRRRKLRDNPAAEESCDT